jgi:lipopolysaccharide heptosyltransferase II
MLASPEHLSSSGQSLPESQRARGRIHSHSHSIELADRAHIILVKIGGIGDFVLMTPALQALRARYPLARIDCIVSGKKVQAFLEKLQVLDTIIVLEKELLKGDREFTFAQRLSQLVGLKHRLYTTRYDAVLCFNHLLPEKLPFLAALMIVTGATYRVGLDCGTAEGLLHVRVPDAGFGARHEVEYRNAVVEAVGARVQDRQPFIPLEADVRAQAYALVSKALGQIQRPLIALHPGCHHTFAARRWPSERFAQLIDNLYMKFGGQAILLGGPEEVTLREEVLASLRSPLQCLSLAGTEELFLSAAIIELCDLFIGNDSGLMHIAAAVKTPTLGIFGPTNPAAWAPFMPVHPEYCSVIFQDLACRPCHYIGLYSGDGLGCPTRACLKGLSVARVAESASQLLTATSRPRLESC